MLKICIDFSDHWRVALHWGWKNYEIKLNYKCCNIVVKTLLFFVTFGFDFFSFISQKFLGNERIARIALSPPLSFNLLKSSYCRPASAIFFFIESVIGILSKVDFIAEIRSDRCIRLFIHCRLIPCVFALLLSIPVFKRMRDNASVSSAASWASNLSSNGCSYTALRDFDEHEDSTPCALFTSSAMIFKESRNKSFISENAPIKPFLSKDLNKTGNQNWNRCGR